ncbi:MAG: PAN domain-containing protein [Alphaproteobacteria bacterium]|nr:PAN domain-containing protein [Alphaproteobacteria bacterium]
MRRPAPVSARTRGALLAGLALTAVLTGSALGAGLFQESNVERWGATYRTVALASADAGLCAQTCSADPACQAWTMVRPGIKAPQALCELKAAVPKAGSSPCCVSGVMTGSESTGAPRTRP